MKKIYLIITTIILSFNFSIAQEYTNSIGIKVGKFSSGITAKRFFSSTNSLAMEGNLTMKKNFGTALATIFLEKQFSLRDSDLKIPLDLILGGGVQTAFYKEGYYKIRNSEINRYYNSGVSMGIDGKVALEHAFSFAPLTFGIEAVPFFEFINPGPENLELAMRLCYVFR